ncbi:MAG: class I SAM-dependent methyltransferase [Blastocatellia bacterium]
MRPVDIATNETYRFVLEHTTSARLRILEIGCGNGELAKLLQADGHDLVAIDSSPEAVENAKRIGVNAQTAQWPDFENEPFDIVLFTRSLHHMHPLLPALHHASGLLKGSGLLIVEDFAFSDVHKEAAKWFYRLLSLLDACGVLLLAEETFGRELLRGGGAFELWRHHVHEINSADSVLRCINTEFTVQRTYSVPYFYRYVSQMVEDNESGGEIISRVLELERETGEKGTGFFLGRRVVARR